MINNNHTRISKTLATNVMLNLGGGATATVNLHLNEEKFLLIEGLGLEAYDYGMEFHSENLSELQILYSDLDEDE